MNPLSNDVFNKIKDSSLEFARGTELESDGKTFKFQLYVRLDSNTGDILEIKAKKKGNCFTRFFREAWHKSKGLTCVRDLENGAIKIEKFTLKALGKIQHQINRLNSSFNKFHSLEKSTKELGAQLNNLSSYQGNPVALLSQWKMQLAEKRKLKKTHTENLNNLANLQGVETIFRNALQRFKDLQVVCRPQFVSSDFDNTKQAGRAPIVPGQPLFQADLLENEEGEFLDSQSQPVPSVTAAPKEAVESSRSELTEPSQPLVRARRASSIDSTDLKKITHHTGKVQQAAGLVSRAFDQVQALTKELLNTAAKGEPLQVIVNLVKTKIRAALDLAELAKQHAEHARQKANEYGSRTSFWPNEAEQIANRAVEIANQAQKIANEAEAEAWKIYAAKFMEERANLLERQAKEEAQLPPDAIVSYFS